MSSQNFNERIWKCNEVRETNVGILNNILIMQDLLIKGESQEFNKDMFIGVLNNLANKVVRMASKNEVEAANILTEQGFDPAYFENITDVKDLIKEVNENKQELTVIREKYSEDKITQNNNEMEK